MSSALGLGVRAFTTYLRGARCLTSVCQVRGAASVVSIAQARCALRATNAPSAGLIHIGAIRALATSTKHGSKREEEEYIKILDALKKTSLDRMDTPNKYQPVYTFPEEVDEDVATSLHAPDRLDPEDIDAALGIRRRKVKEIPPLPKREAVIDELGRSYATGRRKTSHARVWVFPGEGQVTINRMDIGDAFHQPLHRGILLEPLAIAGAIGRFDVMATVRGGGVSGQAQALRHGIATALQRYDPDVRGPLKRAGFLARDPRMVERKHPGMKKARMKFQWVKR